MLPRRWKVRRPKRGGVALLPRAGDCAFLGPNLVAVSQQNIGISCEDEDVRPKGEWSG